MSNLLSTVQQFFEEENWSMYAIPGQTALGTNFTGHNGDWTYLAIVNEEEEEIICYSVFPDKIPEAKRLDFAEFIAKTNYGISIGNFEMDFEDGELRYKTSLNTRGADLPKLLLQHIVYINVAMLDKYFREIGRMLHS